VDATAFKTQDRRLEESLWSTETLIADSDDLAVRKLVGLLQAGGLAGSLNLLLEVERNVAELLLDVTDNFSLGSGGEGVTALGKNLHEVVGQVTASHVDTRDSVRKSETFVDGHNVSDTVTGIKHDTRGTTGGVQRKDSLDGNVEGRRVEGLEDDLGHLLSVRLGVDGSFGEQDWVLLRGDTQLIVEGVVPDLLHIIPVGDDTVLDGISQREDTTLRLCFVTDVGVLLTHANHDTAMISAHYSFEGAIRRSIPMMARSADDGGYSVSESHSTSSGVQGGGLTENSSWRIITGETGFAHTGAGDMLVQRFEQD
jgi:hypothetical protein